MGNETGNEHCAVRGCRVSAELWRFNDREHVLLCVDHAKWMGLNANHRATPPTL